MGCGGTKWGAEEPLSLARPVRRFRRRFDLRRSNPAARAVGHFAAVVAAAGRATSPAPRRDARRTVLVRDVGRRTGRVLIQPREPDVVLRCRVHRQGHAERRARRRCRRRRCRCAAGVSGARRRRRRDTVSGSPSRRPRRWRRASRVAHRGVGTTRASRGVGLARLMRQRSRVSSRIGSSANDSNRMRSRSDARLHRPCHASSVAGGSAGCHVNFHKTKKVCRDRKGASALRSSAQPPDWDMT